LGKQVLDFLVALPSLLVLTPALLILARGQGIIASIIATRPAFFCGCHAFGYR
jgi:hypothetical protein